MAGGKVTCKCGQQRPFNVSHCPHCTHSTAGGAVDNAIGLAIFVFIVLVLINLLQVDNHVELCIIKETTRVRDDDVL